jgi:hypothetical protein
MKVQELIVEIDDKDGRDKRTNIRYEISQKGENVIQYFNRAQGLIELDEVGTIRL